MEKQRVGSFILQKFVMPKSAQNCTENPNHGG